MNCVNFLQGVGGGHVYSEKINTVLTAIFPNLTNKHMKWLAGKSKQGTSSKGYSLIQLTFGIIVTSMKPKQFHNITRYVVVVRTPKSLKFYYITIS